MTTAGLTWEASEYVHLKRGAPVVFTGPFDDAALASSAVFGITQTTTQVTRTCVIGWGSTKTTTFECLIQKYRRIPAKGALTHFEVTVIPSAKSRKSKGES